MQTLIARTILLGVLVVAALPNAAAARKADEPAYEYGPAPDWEQYKALAEEAVRQRLIDPGSAEFSWDYGYHRGGWKPLLQGRIYGYVTCGLVNARNRMGGYAGRNHFAVVIDHGFVRAIELGTPGPYDMVALNCAKAAQRGLLPSAASMASISATGPQLCYTVRPMPEGAYVSAVTPGAPADLAGLQPGMVITAVGGVSLAGMGETIPRILAAASGRVTLTLVGGRQIVIEPAAMSSAGQLPEERSPAF